MAKQKISITVDESMIGIIDDILNNAENGLFRNRSHVIEYSLKRFLNEGLNKNIIEGGK
jgi:Arc/MetJ-type ribon-helix-helix transcriptional regulator